MHGIQHAVYITAVGEAAVISSSQFTLLAESGLLMTAAIVFLCQDVYHNLVAAKKLDWNSSSTSYCSLEI